MPHHFTAQQLLDIGTQLFSSVGAPADEAHIAAEGLVTSSLMGLDSHGVMRYPEYLDLVRDGSIVPGAAINIEQRSPTTAVADCGYNFGAVGASRAMAHAIELAQEQRTACVITRRCNHVGRLGAYVQQAADAGLIALATCNSPKYGHFVLPFGGREGRLATNPIAYGVPTGGDPIVADLSTSVAPEGKVRFYRNSGQALPDGWVLDADGNPTNDANNYYGPPRGGILPLGGSAGHKGFALGMLVEILGSALAGTSSLDEEVVGNGVCFIVIDPSTFCPLDRFRSLMDEMVTYIKSSPPAPGFDEVLVPGELEYRTLRARSTTGIPVDDVTWDAITKHANSLDITLPSNPQSAI